MGAQIDVWRAMTRTLNGASRTFGNLGTPSVSFDTGATDGPAIDDSVVLAAGATMTLWEYGVNSYDWSVGLVEIVGNAVDYLIYLGTMSDAAVSTTNLAAAGTAITWNNEVLTGRVPRFFGGRASRTNATPANHAKTSGTSPNAWVVGQGEVDGYIYKIMANNPGTIDLRIRRIFLG